jgi:CARDB
MTRNLVSVFVVFVTLTLGAVSAMAQTVPRSVDLALYRKIVGPYTTGERTVTTPSGHFAKQKYRRLSYDVEVVSVGPFRAPRTRVGHNYDDIWTGEPVFDTPGTTPRLAPGESRTYRISVDVPASAGRVTGRTQLILGAFNEDEDLAPRLRDRESDNSFAFIGIQQEYFRPNYQSEITELQMTDAPYTATVVIRNDGPESAAAASLADILDDGDSVDGGMVDPLESGESVEMELEISGLGSDTCRLYTARADILGWVDEYSESDNDYSIYRCHISETGFVASLDEAGVVLFDEEGSGGVTLRLDGINAVQHINEEYLPSIFDPVFETVDSGPTDLKVIYAVDSGYLDVHMWNPKRNIYFD